MNLNDCPTPETDANTDPYDEVKSEVCRSIERRLGACREMLAEILKEHKPFGAPQVAIFKKAKSILEETAPK